MWVVNQELKPPRIESKRILCSKNTLREINWLFFSFERELKNKLAQKASGNQSEETVLLKAFKYFDLNNNGTVEPEEFAKAIEKIGIMIPTRQVSRVAFFLRMAL